VALFAPATPGPALRPAQVRLLPGRDRSLLTRPAWRTLATAARRPGVTVPV